MRELIKDQLEKAILGPFGGENENLNIAQQLIKLIKE